MTAQAVFALPATRHLPGRNGRPASGPVLAAATAAPQPTDPGNWAGNAVYLYGFDLLAGGFFWEAHEVWEPVWQGCAPNSRERALLQGLIQSANAGLKLTMDRRAAGQRLIAFAADCFAAAESAGAPGGAVMGVVPTQAARALCDMALCLKACTDGAAIALALTRCPGLQPSYAI